MSNTTTPRLAQLERLDAEGHVQQAWDITAWPVRLGRGLDQDVAWPDPHLAEHHLALDVDARDQLVLLPAATVNGVQLGAHRASAGQAVTIAPGAVWQAGTSRWRVRRRDDPAMPEVPWSAPHAAGASAQDAALMPVPWRSLGGLGVAVLAWESTTLWLDQNPGTTWNAYLTPVLAAVAALTVWVLMWGLVTKLFTHRYTVWPHVRIVLMYLLAMSVLDAAAGVLAYAFDMPALARWAGPLSLALAAAMLAHHLRVVLPQHARRVSTAMAVMTVLGMGVAGALNWQRIDRLMPYQHLSTLPPPALRAASPRPVAEFMQEVQGLETRLKAAAQRAKDEDDPLFDDLD
jgi:hypothetical protein